MKTACEEAAEAFDGYGSVEWPSISKRLRAEGRELKRLRTIIEAIVWKGTHDPAVAGAIRREAARIQRRKAK